MENFTYRHTILACLLSYVTQAVIVSFAPLLFMTFGKTFHIPMEKITLFIVVNFGVQLLTDCFASGYATRIGYRKSLLLAHGLCAAGFVSLAVLPEVLGGLWGLMLSIGIYAVGGGLLEVLISPIIEACPTENKSGMMSLVHSFFCWGTVATVLLSTAFFMTVGIEHWRVLACLWALLPLGNMILFARVPLYSVTGEDKDAPNYKELFGQQVFIALLLMMMATGAAEQAVGQWASYFAENGLGVSKSVGDIVGVCGFSAMMGVSRLWYARKSGAAPRRSAMPICGVLCAVGFGILGFSHRAGWGLFACALCGFSVGLFWPGIFSMAARCVKQGGTTMYALLALAGDLGCCIGPLWISKVAAASDGSLRKGMAAAMIFPLLLLGNLIFLKRE